MFPMRIALDLLITAVLVYGLTYKDDNWTQEPIKYVLIGFLVVTALGSLLHFAVKGDIENYTVGTPFSGGIGSYLKWPFIWSDDEIYGIDCYNRCMEVYSDKNLCYSICK